MISDYLLMDASLIHPPIMCGLGLIILILFIIALILLFFLLTKEEKRTKSRYFLLIILVIGIAVGLELEILLYENMIYAANRDYLHYELTISSTSYEYEIVYMPVCLDSNVRKNLEIKSGTGSFELIGTEYGMALKVNFSGKISIDGEYETADGIGDHDLTLLYDSEEGNIYRGLDVAYWIYYHPANEGNYNCSIQLRLGHGAFDWSEFHEVNTYLRSGWNIYGGYHEAQS